MDIFLLGNVQGSKTKTSKTDEDFADNVEICDNSLCAHVDSSGFGIHATSSPVDKNKAIPSTDLLDPNIWEQIVKMMMSFQIK